MTNNISQAAYAKQRGVTPARINHLISKGVIILVNGKVDPDQADAAIEAAANPAYSKTLGRPAKDRGPSNYADAAAREKHFKALLAELDFKEREGELVDANDLRHELATVFTVVKTSLRSIPAKVAQGAYHLSRNATAEREGVASIFKLMLTEIDVVLTELSKYKVAKK